MEATNRAVDTVPAQAATKVSPYIPDVTKRAIQALAMKSEENRARQELGLTVPDPLTKTAFEMAESGPGQSLQKAINPIMEEARRRDLERSARMQAERRNNKYGTDIELE